jgi:DNA polymerase III subunit gamma/tau
MESPMNQKAVQLNLARKWRSKQFDTVVGQDLPVRILQNSLYSNQFFPVYLFSGQRGCGKTTSARLFAGAINCENLESFQKNPRDQKIPCLICASCIAMTAHKHPDFIEIDAASYTGVDNVRDIIESASLLPVLGRKKMYLIDEAHMLSKAAFNAFLKILEEPPASVIFMLATTDPHKIIETVRSRCFQLFFTSIPIPLMSTEEGIAFDEAALQVIAAETEGSARDAINLLEQVRFSQQRVTVDSILKVLGHMPEQLLVDLFERVIKGDLKELMHLLANCASENYVPLAVWQKSTELVRNLLFIKQGLADTGMFEDVDKLKSLAQLITLPDLIVYLQKLYSYELPLLRSTAQSNVLEMLFIDLCQGVITPSVQQEEKRVSPQVTKPVVPQELGAPGAPVPLQPVAAPLVSQSDARWQAFMKKVEQLSDPLLQSIFKQAHFVSYHEKLHEVTVIFDREANFFTDWLQDTKTTWSGLLESAFGPGISLKSSFGGVKQEQKQAASASRPGSTPGALAAQTTPIVQKQETARPAAKPSYKSGSTHQAPAQEMKKELAIDVSDGEKWQKAHLLKELFGGSIVAIQEDEIHDETGQ